MRSDALTVTPTIRWLQLALGLAYLAVMTHVWANAPAVQSRSGTKVVSVAKFDRILVRGNVNVHLSRGEGDEVLAQGDEAALDALRVEVSDRELVIEVDERSAQSAVHVDVPFDVMPNEIVVSGVALVKAHGLKGDALVLEGLGSGGFDLSGLDVEELIVDGAGRTRFGLSGRVRHQSVNLSGHGHYAASRLHSDTCQVRVQGAGEVRLWTDRWLDVDVLGSAVVTYSGAPYIYRSIKGMGGVFPHQALRATAL